MRQQRREGTVLASFAFRATWDKHLPPTEAVLAAATGPQSRMRCGCGRGPRPAVAVVPCGPSGPQQASRFSRAQVTTKRHHVQQSDRRRAQRRRLQSAPAKRRAQDAATGARRYAQHLVLSYGGRHARNLNFTQNEACCLSWIQTLD